MKSVHAAAALTLVSGASAFWRMPCRSRTGLARMDPLMDPNEISDHVHSIFGGGSECPDAARSAARILMAIQTLA